MTKYERFYSSKVSLKGSGTQRTTDCPFCEHKNDLSINIETGQCKCFQCDFEGDAFDFLQKLEKEDFTQAKEELMKYGIEPITKRQELEVWDNPKSLSAIIEVEMLQYAEKCVTNLPDHVISYLKEVRGLNDKAISEYRIGFCHEHPKYMKDKYERLTIPIGRNGKVINIRFHALGEVREGDFKTLPYRSGLPGAISLFPEDQLENDVIYLVEGELDALCAISHGLSAVTVTGGAGSWKEEWTPLFKEKKVRVIYDCDAKGREGARKVATILLSIADEVKLIGLGLGNKKDLTDWFVEYGKTKEELEELISKTEVMRIPRKVTDKQERIIRVAEELSIQSLTLGKLISTKFIAEQFWVNKGLVPKGGAFVLLAGLTKQGKTTLTLQLCLRLLEGDCTFLRDFEVEGKPKILYVFAENSLDGLQNIVKKQLSGLTWTPSKADLERLVLQPRGRVFLDDKDGLPVLAELLHIHTPDLVILDPISRFISKDMNEMRNVNCIFDGLSGIGKGVTWFFISHYRKPTTNDINEPIYKTIGSSAFANNCDTFIGLERTDKHRTGLYSTLNFKIRRARPIEPVHLYWNPDNLLFDVVEKRDILSGGVKALGVVKILKDDFKGKAAYSLITSSASEKFKITKQRAGELLVEAKELGLVSKEKGHFGRWFSL
ncbi:DNA primase [subsurface metagenome]